MAFFAFTADRAQRAQPWLRPLVALGIAVLAGPAGAAAPEPSRENQIKAVFLFNFPQFVDWPDSAFASAQAPLVIGILGSDPFDGFLDQLVRGETVNRRPIVVRRFARLETVAGCQELFVSRSESGHLKEICARLWGRSILTVSDADAFTQDGGMIRLSTENNRIRIHIDLAAAQAGGLTISSKLLRRAALTSNRPSLP